MKILLVCPTSVSPASGNVCTVQRITQHLSSQNIVCVTRGVDAIIPQNAECAMLQLKKYLTKNLIDGVLFLHAYKSAKILLCSCGSCMEECLNITYGIIFGGTDLNVDIFDKRKCLIMKKTLANAKFAVAFTSALKNIASQLLPQLKVLVQPQAVEISGIERNDLEYTDNNFNMLGYNMKHYVYGFLMITGIRPVKDPIFLLESWIKWCRENQYLNLKLLIIGPVLDLDFANRFFELIASLKKSWIQSTPVSNHWSSKVKDLQSIYDWFQKPDVFPILYAPELPRKNLNILMRSSFIFASVNSSQSEGMASSILESMANKIPVIARDNSGNRSLVEHSKTGLLYHTGDEFVKQAEKLIKNQELKSLIADNAYQMILNEHSMEKEKKFYVELCQELFLTE